MSYIDTKTIGGSDVGALLGINSYSTALDVYERLVDPKPRHGTDTNDSPATRRGKRMEPLIADIYTETTTRLLAECERRYHPTYTFCHASPDRVIVGDERGPGVLEIKCHNAYVFRQAKDEGVNPSYYAQLQHYLWVTGWQWGAFALFWPDGWELHPFDVERDVDTINMIEEAVTTFWNDCVLAKKPPGREWGAPKVELQPASSEARGQSVDVVTRRDPQWLTFAEELKTAQLAYNLTSKTLDDLKTQIKGSFGEGIKTQIGGGLRATIADVSRPSLDKDLLIQEHPEIDIKRYTKTTVSRSLTLTWEKPRK